MFILGVISPSENMTMEQPDEERGMVEKILLENE